MISITRPLPLALLIGLAVGIAIGVSVTAIAGAQGTTETADVRITARLLENGKVEFGLQQQEGDGWGEIILPRVNKFPYARATVDRWLYSSGVAVTTTGGAASGWQRTADTASVDWHLDGTGEYNAAGRAADRTGIGFDAAPQLRLSCFRSGDSGDWGAIVTFDAPGSYTAALDSDAGFSNERLWYRVEGGPTNYGTGILIPRVEPSFFVFSGRAFVDWLSVNYRRNPTLHLDALGDGVHQFSGTFDLTGLPAVLADLPCFGPFE